MRVIKTGAGDLRGLKAGVVTYNQVTDVRNLLHDKDRATILPTGKAVCRTTVRHSIPRWASGAQGAKNIHDYGTRLVRFRA